MHFGLTNTLATFIYTINNLFTDVLDNIRIVCKPPIGID